MSDEILHPGSAQDWLRYARSDLELARIDRPDGVLLENLCFHAQQAAEKALKAVLISVGVPSLRTHNLRTLLDLLPEGIEIPVEVGQAAILTDYAVEFRYPGSAEPVDTEEYRQAVHLAGAVVSWAESIMAESREEET